MSLSDYLTHRDRDAGEPIRIKAARLLSAVIFYGLIGLLLFAPMPYGSVEPWSHAVFECVVFSLALLWCIHAMMTGKWFAGNLRLFLPMLAAVVLALLQSLAWSRTTIAGVSVAQSISADPYESRIFAIRLFALMVAGLLALRFTNSWPRLTILSNSVVGIALLSAVFGIIRLTAQHTDGFLLASLPRGGGFAQFINKNHFAFLAEPAIGILLVMILLRNNVGHRKLIYLSGLVLLWAALVLSRSRAALVAAAVQMIVAALIFLYTKLPARGGIRGLRRTRSLAIAALAILAIIVAVAGTTVWLGGDQLSTGVETAATEMSANIEDFHESSRRRDIWRATLKMARAHPLLGTGLGAYWAEIPLYHDGSGVLTPQQAHNDYLEVLASGGLVGVGLLVWFVVAAIQQTRRAFQRLTGVQHVLALGAIIGIVGVAVHSLFDFGLHMMGNAAVFVMLLAILSMNSLDQRAVAQAHRSEAFI